MSCRSSGSMSDTFQLLNTVLPKPPLVFYFNIDLKYRTWGYIPGPSSNRPFVPEVPSKNPVFRLMNHDLGRGLLGESSSEKRGPKWLVLESMGLVEVSHCRIRGLCRPQVKNAGFEGRTSRGCPNIVPQSVACYCVLVKADVIPCGTSTFSHRQLSHIHFPDQTHNQKSQTNDVWSSLPLRSLAIHELRLAGYALEHVLDSPFLHRRGSRGGTRSLPPGPRRLCRSNGS